jgi:hypothetical protein
MEQLSYTQFKEQHKGPFGRVTNLDKMNCGKVLSEGYNENELYWNEFEGCPQGGIWFVSECNFKKYIDMGDILWMVEVNDDAKIYIKNDRFYADKVHLKEMRPLYTDGVRLIYQSRDGDLYQLRV